MTCPRCDRSQSGKGNKLCEKHRLELSARYHASPKARIASRERQRRVRAKKVERSQCYGCDAPAAEGRKYCTECLGRYSELAQRWYWDNHEAVTRKARSAEGKRKNRAKTVAQYGLTLEQYDEMLEAQGGVCAICKKPEGAIHWQTGEVRSLAVDHDHATGRVRALLCHRCNRVFGLLEEDPELISSMLDYSIMSAGRQVLQDLGFLGSNG